MNFASETLVTQNISLSILRKFDAEPIKYCSSSSVFSISFVFLVIYDLFNKFPNFEEPEHHGLDVSLISGMLRTD